MRVCVLFALRKTNLAKQQSKRSESRAYTLTNNQDKVNCYCFSPRVHGVGVDARLKSLAIHPMHPSE